MTEGGHGPAGSGFGPGDRRSSDAAGPTTAGPHPAGPGTADPTTVGPHPAGPGTAHPTSRDSGAPIDPEILAARSGRIVDRGAVFAGWVGLGLALVIAISFALVLAVQPLVFLSAPIAGIVIGSYANGRSARWRPRSRVFLNAGYAGLVTGVGLAVMYAFIRLLFVYFDSGYRPEPLGGQITCQMGPECTYMRLLADGRGADLAAAGITDAASFEAALLQEQLLAALIIVGLIAVGALVVGAFRAAQRPPPST